MTQAILFLLAALIFVPLAVRAGLRNVPAEAVFNWEPQGQIGLYRPDTFFYAD